MFEIVKTNKNKKLTCDNICELYNSIYLSKKQELHQILDTSTSCLSSVSGLKSEKPFKTIGANNKIIINENSDNMVSTQYIDNKNINKNRDNIMSTQYIGNKNSEFTGKKSKKYVLKSKKNIKKIRNIEIKNFNFSLKKIDKNTY